MSTFRRGSLATVIAVCEAILGVVLLYAAFQSWTYEPGHSPRDDGTGAAVATLLARGVALVVAPYAALLLFAAALLWRGRQSGIGLTMSLAALPGALASWTLTSGGGFPAVLVMCGSLASVVLTLQLRVAAPPLPCVDDSTAGASRAVLATATYRTLDSRSEARATATATPGKPTARAPHPMFRIGSGVALVVLILFLTRAFGGP